MFHALEGLQDALNGDLDTEEAARIEKQLTRAGQSDEAEIVLLAKAIGSYIQQEKQHLLVTKPGLWMRMARQLNAMGLRLERPLHRGLITVILILWLLLLVSYIVIIVVANPALEDQIVRWRTVLIFLQATIGAMLFVGVKAWLTGNEERGLKFAVIGFVISLVALQSLYFFFSQFQAITVTLIQFVILLIMLSYRRRYLPG